MFLTPFISNIGDKTVVKRWLFVYFIVNKLYFTDILLIYTSLEEGKILTFVI